MRARASSLGRGLGLLLRETPTARARSAGPAVRNQAASQPAGAVYQGASSTRRLLGWKAPTVSPNAAILGSLWTLRDRSRAAVRNDGYAKSAIERLVTNLIGTGIKPLSQATDAAFRRAVQALWLRWTDESDADGRLDFYGQQSQAARAWLEAGEVFVRFRPRRPEDGLSVPLQLQVVEPELCPHTYDRIGTNGSPKIRAGIEFDAIGRRTAYWFYRSRPGELQDFDPSELVRVPADRVLHLYEPTRPGQLRGVPALTPALVKLHDLDVFDDATLLRQQLANLFVAFLTRQASLGGGETLNPITGQAIDLDEAGRALLGLEPGLFAELAPGEGVTFSDPPEPAQTYPDFMRQQLFGVAAAVGVPYEVLTGDLSKVNDRTVRVILNEFRRRVMAAQHQILAFQLCRPVWRAWLDQVVLTGALPIPAAAYGEDPEPWAKVKWIPQGWPYLNPVQDVEAQRAAIRAGLTTRSAAVSEQGEDAEEIDAEQAVDNQRADALGLIYDSDARKTAGTGAAQAPDAADPSAAQSGPPISVSVTVPPLTVRPTPVVNVTVPKPSTKRVHRDARGLIECIEDIPQPTVKRLHRDAEGRIERIEDVASEPDA